MLNKLSRKDIELLNILAQTPEGKSALNEYIEQHEKAVKAYKIYRESVVAEVEVEKVVKPVESKRKFKVGDKVRVLRTGSLSAATLLREGDIAVVTGYKEYDNFMLAAMGGEPLRPVIVRSMEGGGLLSTYPTGFFEESALELVVEEEVNESHNKKVRKFKAGDKVRILKEVKPDACSRLSVGDVSFVEGYKEDFLYWEGGNCSVNIRPVIVNDGSAKGKSLGSYFEESALELVEEKTPNELRAEVIQRAKEFVEECRNRKMVVRVNSNGYVVDVSFIVNANKRTVVALMTGAYTDLVRGKGIAKCNPSDVFNKHIGKAIALGRALGKDVSEFENAVQPTEPVVGHVVKGYEALGFYRQDRKFTLTSKKDCDSFYYPECNEYDTDSHNDFIYNWQIGAIIDDTNAIYEEEK